MRLTPEGIKLNPKCVVISTGLGLAYLYLPHNSPAVFLGILIGSYVGIAYYDDYFDCSDRLSIDSPLGNSFGWLKPAPDWETRTYGTHGKNR